MAAKKREASAKKPARKPGPPTAIGQRLGWSRALHGLSNRALSERAGLAHSMVSQVINGAIQDPTVGALIKIARAAGVDFAWLATGDGEPRPWVQAPQLTGRPAPHPEDAWRSANVATGRPMNDKRAVSLDAAVKMLAASPLPPSVVDDALLTTIAEAFERAGAISRTAEQGRTGSAHPESEPT